MDHNLVLVVPVLQLEDMFTRLVLVLLCLLEDAQSLHSLFDFTAADLVLDLVNLRSNHARILHQFGLVSRVLLEAVKAGLDLLPLPAQSVRVCICFIDVGIEALWIVF